MTICDLKEQMTIDGELEVSTWVDDNKVVLYSGWAGGLASDNEICEREIEFVFGQDDLLKIEVA
jgi:hypothetical protein